MEQSEDDKTYFIFNDLLTDTYIYRYMDLDHFLCMVKDRKFYVSKKKSFEDLNEIRPPHKNLYPICVGGNNGTLDYTHIAEEVKRISKKWKDYKDTGEWFTSCWTLWRDENYLMWKAYASKFGVRICTTIDRFVDSITPNDFFVLCGRITYDGYYPEKESESLIFSKGKYYSNEEELRFYFIPKSFQVEKDYIELPIKLKDDNSQDIIKEIILSPCIKKKAAEEMKNMLKNIPELMNCNISLSKIELK